MLLLVSGSPGVSQSLHTLDCSPQQSLPSAAEALHMAAEASETANSPSVKQFRSSPSMPSLSSCTAGVFKLCLLTVVSWVSSYSPAHSCFVLFCVFSGLVETSKANGSSHSQDHFVSLAQATVASSVIPHPQKGKGTFTDDLLQLVDNFARDAISLSQCKRGPKNGATAVLGHDVSALFLFLASNHDDYQTSVH